MFLLKIGLNQLDVHFNYYLGAWGTDTANQTTYLYSYTAFIIGIQMTSALMNLLNGYVNHWIFDGVIF
jgi:hypothetical protein